MPVDVILPRVDMDMVSGRISRWFVAEGDIVKKGQVLFEIETDKSAMEVDSPTSGIIKDISGASSGDILVGSSVARIFQESEPYTGKTAVSSASDLKVENKFEKNSFLDHDKLESIFDAVDISSNQKGVANATPLARRLAKEKSIDLSLVQGTGPKGRVQSEDVLKYKTDFIADSKSNSANISAPSDLSVKKLFSPGSFVEVPHDTMRKTIARRLLESKQTVPHFYVSADCELDRLLAAREEMNAAAPLVDGKPIYKISVNDFVIKALAQALIRVPDANVSWTEHAMLKHLHADVGVAVSIPGGLITPIVRQAETKSLTQISAEMKDYAARAKARKLKPEEYQGGTTAVSNLGMFGVKEFSAIVNPPHATILAVGAGEQRAVVKGGQLAIATVMTVTLSTDHRAVDGALGAELIQTFKKLIENPLAMLA